MTNTKHDERKQSLEWFLEGRSAVHCDSSGAGRWVKGVGGGRASKTWSPCDYHLMRVSLLILSKNVPITRTSTLSELWLCIWGKDKKSLWSDWDDLWGGVQQPNFVHWQQNDMLTTLCLILSQEKVLLFISRAAVGSGGDLDSLAGWPSQLSFI